MKESKVTMTPVSLSLDASRHVNAAAVAAWYTLRDRKAAVLKEVDAAIELEAYAPERKALRARIEASHEGDLATIAAMEANCALLETAVAEEKRALVHLESASAMLAIAPADRVAYLRCRDDRDHAAHVVNLKAAARKEAASRIPGAPDLRDVAGVPERVTALVSAIGNKAAYDKYGRDYDGQGDVERSTWESFLNIGEADWAFVPLAVARFVRQSKPFYEDANRKSLGLPLQDFIREMTEFRARRARHILNKAQAAQSALAAAQSNVAALQAVQS
jgi:hypothetical protein